MVRELAQFKHDFQMHAFMMKNLCCQKEYEKLGEYLRNIFPDSEKVELTFKHSNLSVSIMISSLIQEAKDMGILLSVKLEVNDFMIPDEDICSIFNNLITNSLDEVSRVLDEKEIIELTVFEVEKYYEIRCKNACFDAEKCCNLRIQIEEGNMEIKIIEEIVKKYDGAVEKNKIITSEKEKALVETVVRIPFQ